MVKNVDAIQTNYTIGFLREADYNTKIVEIENKIPGHDKYIATNDFDKFSYAICNEKLQQPN